MSSLKTATIDVLMWSCGLPRRCRSEDGAPPGRVSRILLVGMALGTLVPFVAPDIYNLAYRPDQPFAGAGLPWVISFFLHGGLLHFFGNAAFLLLFGEEVEHEVGSTRFVLLIVLSDLAGTMAETILIGGDVPLIGASAGISGALAAYVLLFPWRELEVPTSWVIPLAFRGRYWITTRVPWLLSIWLGHQFLGAYLGSEEVAFSAHIGGAAAGALVVLFWRRRDG